MLFPLSPCVSNAQFLHLRLKSRSVNNQLDDSMWHFIDQLDAIILAVMWNITLTGR